jgi:hypothetical protein
MSFARVRALVVVGVLVVFALVFVVIAIVRDSQGKELTAKSCPAGYKLVNIALPEEKDVKINVYNATTEVGLAKNVGSDFKNRKFQVLKMGDDPLKKGLSDVAALRFGPKAYGAAWLLRAYFLDQNIDREYDPNRTDDVVDVVLGTGFQQLATQTETRQSLAEIGRPDLPTNGCPAPEKKKKGSRQRPAG